MFHPIVITWKMNRSRVDELHELCVRIVFTGENRLGLDVLSWLLKNGEDIFGLVVHPEDRARHREEIVEVSGLPDQQVK